MKILNSPALTKESGVTLGISEKSMLKHEVAKTYQLVGELDCCDELFCLLCDGLLWAAQRCPLLTGETGKCWRKPRKADSISSHLPLGPRGSDEIFRSI